jgi:hypothetical protein
VPFLVRAGRTAISVALLGLFLFACQQPGTGVILDGSSTNLDAGLASADAFMQTRSDAGASADGSQNFERGVRLSEVATELLHVTADESEIHYFDENHRLMRISPDGSNQAMIAERVRFISKPAPVFWTFMESSVSRAHSHVRSYRAQKTISTPLTSTSAYGLLQSHRDGEWALTTDNFHIQGQGDTSTNTADLVYLNADGTQSHTLVPRINLGVWDDREERFRGKCSLNFVFTSTASAIAAACLGDAERRTLIHIDLAQLRTSSLAEGVRAFLSYSDNAEHFLWADLDRNIYASNLRGTKTVHLPESESINTVKAISKNGFAYTTESDQLRIAHWPSLIPKTIQTFGANRIRAVSPDGSLLLFSPQRAAIGSLFMIGTSTLSLPTLITLNSDNDSYPGDTPFSADSSHVFWYARSDQNYIGNLMSRSTQASANPKVLGLQAYFVQNYANPDKVLLMINARLSSQNQQVIADLAVRSRNGLEPLEILVPRVHSSNLIVFPNSKRVVYNVIAGPNAGIWVRALP